MTAIGYALLVPLLKLSVALAGQVAAFRPIYEAIDEPAYRYGEQDSLFPISQDIKRRWSYYRRSQFDPLPDKVIGRIEQITVEAFGVA